MELANEAVEYYVPGLNYEHKGNVYNLSVDNGIYCFTNVHTKRNIIVGMLGTFLPDVASEGNAFTKIS